MLTGIAVLVHLNLKSTMLLQGEYTQQNAAVVCITQHVCTNADLRQLAEPDFQQNGRVLLKVLLSRASHTSP